MSRSNGSEDLIHTPIHRRSRLAVTALVVLSLTFAISHGNPTPPRAAADSSTSTVTPTTTATGTAIPTGTPTPTPTFFVIAAEIAYGSSNPARLLSRPSLSQIRVHQKVKLIVYVALSAISTRLPAALGMRVTSGSTTVFFRKQAVSLGPSQNGTQPFWLPWSPTKPGIDRLTGTFFLGGRDKQAASPLFSVVGGPQGKKPIYGLAAGAATLEKLEDSVTVYGSVYRYGSNGSASDGAYGANIGAPARAWFLEEQRAGGLDVMAGVFRDDPRLIKEGLLVFHYGLERQAANGSFPGSAWPFHGVAMFMSEAGPALVVLEGSQYAQKFSSEIRWDVERMHKAAYYMVRYVHGPQHIDDTTKNHRLFEAAIALGSEGILADDATLSNWSTQYAWRGIHMQHANGVMPENGGHDSGYQALGMTDAIRYLALVATGGLYSSLYRGLQKGEAWELSRINQYGEVNPAGDTRTRGCVETGPSGQCKTTFYAPITGALARWAAVTGDERFAHAAKLVHSHI